MSCYHFVVPRPNHPIRLLYSFPDFTRADDNFITDILANHFDTFCALSDRQDIDYLVNYFEDLVKSCVRRFVPLKTKKSNTNLP